MYNHNLNVNLSICLKIYTKVIQKIFNVDGRISPDDITSDTSIVNLYFTKPGNVIPFIKLNITTTEVPIRKISFQCINKRNPRRIGEPKCSLCRRFDRWNH